MSANDDIPPGFTQLHSEPPRQNRTINRIAWSPNGHIIASPSDSQAIRLWDIQTGQSLRTLAGHAGVVYSVAWSPDEQQQELASSSSDGTIRIWDAQTGQSLRTLAGHQGAVHSVAWSPNGTLIASGSLDKTIRLWDARTGKLLQTLIGHSEPVYSVAWSPDGELIASGSSDGLIYLWEKTGRIKLKLTGHFDAAYNTPSQVYSLAWSPDGSVLASGSADRTIRLWDPKSKSGRQIRCLEGHTGVVTCLSFSSDSRLLASKSRDRTVRIWRTDTWLLAAAMKESTSVHSVNAFSSLAFHPRSPILASLGANLFGVQDTIINLWLLDVETVLSATPDASSIYYTNAKVALVGDSGVGKSALALVLTDHPFAPTESTHGRKVWDFKTQRVERENGHVEIRETLLWDLAGQPGYRLIHQLHLNEVAVALIVFDARSETDPFAGVYHWVRSLQVAQRVQSTSGSPTRKLLVAARIDRGGKSVTPVRINTLIQELKLDGYFEVSARDGLDIGKLIDAIERAIVWEVLPKVTSTDLFQRIKEFLSIKKQTGRLLSTVEELYREFLNFEGRLTETEGLFAQFETCIGLVEAKDLIRRFSFGDFVLLQPEWLDAYASALITVARDEPDGLGSILEKDVRAGNFYVPDSERIQDKKQEQLLLLAMIEDLVRYEIALREQGADGSYLVFPFQSIREARNEYDPDTNKVIFRYEGPVLNIYATLAVRLSHSDLFSKKELWRNAITYTSMVGGTYGLEFNNIGEGLAELTLFFDEKADEVTCFHFEEYVKLHLQRRALPNTIIRRRIFVCPKCKTPISDLQATRRRELQYKWIRCNVCDTEISLLDREERLPSLSLPPSRVPEMDNAANKKRDRDAAQLKLQGKIVTGDFDVFLCHNNRDKLAVKEIGEKLKERGILPWLDEWELQPGLPWQRLLEECIAQKQIKSAAVFVGEEGIGPWQHMELEAFLREFVERQCPVIPVILPTCEKVPEIPMFLRNMTWVDFREKVPDPMERLLWGISGERGPVL